ncbi:YhcH/YjgK/YiaL family protein [Campylobacter lari]|uniref:YhcH/YjgK/YiaL family protein n=1 Tax=Campylobacter lari TaxID=201 RepID=A0A7M1MHC2_CAMLA|nr:YhcH/YjgK/YiaL family protein [Campylobacter lari]
MAIFCKLRDIGRYNIKDLNLIFSYLSSCINLNSKEFQRLHAYNIGAFEKIELTKDIFVLEQTYFAKNKNQAFFESHKDYIDIQFIVSGKEKIEFGDKELFEVEKEYDKTKDLIIYKKPKFLTSSLILNENDIAIFYPEDVHMPGLSIEDDSYIIKTVVKCKI